MLKGILWIGSDAVNIKGIIKNFHNHTIKKRLENQLRNAIKINGDSRRTIS